MSDKTTAIEVCAVHTWVAVDTGRKVKLRYEKDGVRKKRKVPVVRHYCRVCGKKRPKPKLVVRLVVLNRRVTCPLGYNEADGMRKLHDCYLDSVTSGHRCVDPEQTGAKRCPHVATFHKQYGWRTWYRSAVHEHHRYGVLHQRDQLQVLYSPLNAEGTKWYAFNAKTGQRFEVKLDGSGQEWTWNQEARTWRCSSRDTTRRTPEGERIEQDYRFNYVLNPNETGMVRFGESTPIWAGVTPSNDRQLCNCINCLEYRRSSGATMSVAEFSAATGLHIAGPQPDKPLLDPSKLPSAQPKPIGDPATCQDCKFARCRVHRMVFMPKDPRTVAASRTTEMVDTRTGKTGTLSELGGKKAPAATATARTVTTKDEWGRTRVVGGHGDVGLNVMTTADVLTRGIKKAAKLKKRGVTVTPTKAAKKAKATEKVKASNGVKSKTKKTKR